MKVLFISEYFPPKTKGGGEISCYLLAKELVKSGTKVHVLTSYFSGLRKKEAREGVIIHRNLKTGENPAKINDNLKRLFLFETSLHKELIDLDKKENFDLIHCFNTNSMVAVKLKNKIKKKFIMHVNGPTPFCPKATLMYKDKEFCNKKCTRLTFLDCFLNSKYVGKRELNPLTKYNPFAISIIRKRYETFQNCLNKYNHYFAISNFMKQELLKRGIRKERVSVIYNITQYEDFLKLKVKKNKTKKILYLGPYTKPKGPQILVSALKKIKLLFEAKFYGSGGLKKELINASKGLNIKINNKVSYGNIPKIMEEHDILVVPSLVGEAFGRVALEGCAAGKIVVASNIGGLPDIIKNRKTGFLFEPGNVTQLTKLLSDVLCEKNGLNSKDVRKRIKDKFSNEKNVSKVIKTYKSLINK